MEKVFIYWDNSNIFTSAQEVAAEREGGTARHRVQIEFRNMLTLARANRETGHALAAGSIPPQLRHVWNRMENEGVEVESRERDALQGREQGVENALQVRMLRDAYDHGSDPGIAVLLTGDGAGFWDGAGFHADLERMHKRGWRIEVLSWQHSCNNRMKKWAEEKGKFIALDDFYESVTRLEPPMSGQPIGDPREAAPVDLSKRP